MAIEPLRSAVTFQAQQTVKDSQSSTSTVNTEVIPDSQTENVDATTAAVDKTQAGDSEKENDKDSFQQQNNKNAQAPSEQLKQAIAEMNRKINNSNEEAVFGIHEETNRVTIKILDKDTKEILKEFPPEKTLDMIAKIWEVAGIIVDEKL